MSPEILSLLVSHKENVSSLVKVSDTDRLVLILGPSHFTIISEPFKCK